MSRINFTLLLDENPSSCYSFAVSLSELVYVPIFCVIYILLHPFIGTVVILLLLGIVSLLLLCYVTTCLLSFFIFLSLLWKSVYWCSVGNLFEHFWIILSPRVSFLLLVSKFANKSRANKKFVSF